MIKECKTHGMWDHKLRATRWRCAKCSSEAVTKHRKAIKRKLVEVFGGECSICGYSKCIGALEFHHIDPSTKEFALSMKGLTKSYARLLKEAQKCALLCANCHREIEEI